MLNKADRVLLHDLEACALPPGGFRHRDHVRAAWAMLRLEPAPRAMARFRASLKRFATHADAPGLYHETITSAFLFAINERIQRLDADHGWEEFAAANPELLEDGRAFLDAYYSRERIESEIARRHFLLPDRPGHASPAEGALHG